MFLLSRERKFLHGTFMTDHLLLFSSEYFKATWEWGNLDNTNLEFDLERGEEGPLKFFDRF